MKNSNVIPKEASKFNQGSVTRPVSDQNKAYLTLKPQGWDKDKDKQIKCKLSNVKTEKSAGFEKVLYQLKGNKGPEKFILWTKDLNNKVVTSKPDWDLIFMSLIDLTNKSVNAVIQALMDQFVNLRLIFGDYSPFQNKSTQKKLLVETTKIDSSIMTNAERKAALDAFVKKPNEINPLFLKEILFRLEELIFGTDMIGCNTYQLLQRLIGHYTVNSN